MDIYALDLDNTVTIAQELSDEYDLVKEIKKVNQHTTQ